MAPKINPAWATKKEPTAAMPTKPTEPVYIAVMGSPGAGKGTLCAKFAKDPSLNHLGIYHLSVGDYLRERVQSGTLPPDAVKAVAEQTLIPGGQIVALLNDKLKEERKNGWRMFLLDGFPRKVDQMHTFTKEVGPLAFAIHIECKEKIALQRYLFRARAGDNEASFHKRYAEFLANDRPLLLHFKKKAKLVAIASDMKAYFDADELYPVLKLIFVEHLKTNGMWETETKVGAS